MNFDANNLEFEPNQLNAIEQKLNDDGYVRIQFSATHLPLGDPVRADLEEFFIEFIENLGGRCLAHDADPSSLVWHVRPADVSSDDSDPVLARSQTTDDFSFHTDCSYEIHPPEYMALFVLHQDQCDGGKLQIIRLSDVLARLSAATKTFLINNRLPIQIPEEFRKSSSIDHINEPLLLGEDRIRYRSDILSEHNGKELNELHSAIEQVDRYEPALTNYTMIILNNHQYLHGRTEIFDRRRHLLRIRFNRPFPYRVFSIYDRNKLRDEYLTFSNDFYEYCQDRHADLHRILKLIVRHYDQPTDLGEEIRQTFQFDARVHSLLTQLNLHRPNFLVGSYRPDVLFGKGDLFQINGTLAFQPKICEINTRFPFNGYLLSARLCSTGRHNRYATEYSHLVETMLGASHFDRHKRMFIIKGREDGYDIHLFREYWTRVCRQECTFVDPTQLNVRQGRLFDQQSDSLIEQCVLELHQDEILSLSDDILHLFVSDSRLTYLNDLRTIFLLHDKRLFSLLSNSSFLYALLNEHVDPSFAQLIPTTFPINRIPTCIKDSIVKNKQHWCIKPNAAGKGEQITIGR